MRFHQAPRPLLQLVTTILLAPRFALAFPNPQAVELGGVSFNELFARDCAGTLCGSEGQFCCAQGSACVTQGSIALCTADSGAKVTQAANDGSWKYYTTTYVETDLVTRTSIWSSYVGGGVAAPTGTAGTHNPNCNYALNEVSCGSICCTSQQYCYKDGQCAAAAGGSSSDFYSKTPGATAGPPLRPTTSGQTTVTRSVTPTTTMPFMTPVATGANVTVTGMQQEDGGGGGLSGGAIAGIVIGVLAGLALLALICFYCCVKGLLTGCLACFGLGGRKNRRRTEIEEYERHSRHSRHGSHYGSGAGGGRTWYGGVARPPARVDRRDSSSKKNLLGVGAGLAALWAVLGLKRRRDNKRRDDEKTEYSYSSDYYTTSSSSSSSDDRRTRNTRYSRR